MMNRSFQEGVIPKKLVKPLLKKPGLDLVHQSFRPVSNLSLVSKATEKAVVNQLLTHCNDNRTIT